jgi:hypothetical protein
VTTKSTSERLLRSAHAAITAARRGFVTEWAAPEKGMLRMGIVQERKTEFMERRRLEKAPDLDRPDFIRERIETLEKRHG